MLVNKQFIQIDNNIELWVETYGDKANETSVRAKPHCVFDWF